MKTPEQLKGAIRSMAATKNLRAQEVLQMFMFERVLERLANSAYQKNFIQFSYLSPKTMVLRSKINRLRRCKTLLTNFQRALVVLHSPLLVQLEHQKRGAYFI